MTTNPFLPGDVSTAPRLVEFCREMLWANHFGRKACTSRSKKIGDPGTLFRDAENRVYRIIKVQQNQLRTIADTCMHQHHPEWCNECSRHDIYTDRYSPRDELPGDRDAQEAVDGLRD